MVRLKHEEKGNEYRRDYEWNELRWCGFYFDF